MHRFHLPPAECHKDPLLLTGREAHHALSVLRLRERDRVAVLNGAGDEFLCEVQKAGRREVALRVVGKNTVPPPPWQVTLCQAVTKGKAMERIVQQATELGAHRIVPILSERTVPRVEAGAVPNKIARWEATAVEAIKQCGSAWLPRLETPLTPMAFLARGEKFDLALIASLQGDARHPREHFDAFRAEQKRPATTVCVWVGPEGDFSPGEIEAVRASGALPMTLGRSVLRSDTAAIYCLSVIHYELHSQRNRT